MFFLSSTIQFQNKATQMILESFPRREEFAELAKTATVIPVGVKILADTETPVSVLARFANTSENVFLFESADGGERWAGTASWGLLHAQT